MNTPAPAAHGNHQLATRVTGAIAGALRARSTRAVTVTVSSEDLHDGIPGDPEQDAVSLALLDAFPGAIAASVLLTGEEAGKATLFYRGWLFGLHRVTVSLPPGLCRLADQRSGGQPGGPGQFTVRVRRWVQFCRGAGSMTSYHDQ